MIKSIVLASSLALFAGQALADDVRIGVPLPGIEVEHHDRDHRELRRDDGGCSTKTVTRQNDEGDTVSKTRTDC